MKTLSEIRSQIRAHRQALGVEEQLRLSLAANRRFLSWFASQTFPTALNRALRVALYRPIEEEVRLNGIVQDFSRRKLETFYPRISDWNQCTLEMVKIRESDASSWTKSPQGLLEPISSLPAIPAEEIDLCVVPGVAFTLAGARVGMGKGFYDRYLARAKNALRVALAYEFQWVESIPLQHWDIPMDWIITEQRIVECSPQKS